jgi:GNAT superfamily N-acetyltransferase
VGLNEWTRGRAEDLAALAAAALPDEALSADELLTSCWDDLTVDSPATRPVGAGTVLAVDDGCGAVSVVVRPAVPGGLPIAFVQLVVVHPDARRAGRGHELLAAAEQFAWDQGAGEIRLEGAPPFYLWPGIDSMATEMLCLAESRAYQLSGMGLNMVMPSLFRAPAPDGVTIRRVLEDVDRGRVRSLIERTWPEWWPEAERAIEHGCCHGAFATVGPVSRGADPGEAVGFACHSVSRAGWLGPMGTDPTRRTGGIGHALVAQVCRDLMIAEYPDTEICWAGPLRFYAKAGATVSRTFRQYRLPRP